MSATTSFEMERLGKVAHLRLNRPQELNTMTPAFWAELPATVRELDAGGDVRALVVSSTGRHFSAGMDLRVFSESDLLTNPRGAEAGRARARLLQTVRLLQDSLTCLEQARMPVLAAIQGGCIGGAVDLVSACDLRYASTDAFFCVQETNIGMTADLGSLQRLPRIIPEGIARELAYRGHRMPASRAREVGLVNEVFADHESLVTGVLEVAEEIAAQSPLAVWGTKEMITYARDHSVAEGLEHVAAWQSGMFQPADLTEAAQARRQHRAAQFDDLLPRPTDL